MRTSRLVLPTFAPLSVSCLLFVVWVIQDVLDEWYYRPYTPIHIDNVWLWVCLFVQCVLNTVRRYKQLSSEMTLVSTTSISRKLRVCMFCVSFCMSSVHTCCTYFLIVFGVFVRPPFMYTWLACLFVSLYICNYSNHHIHRFMLSCKTTQTDGFV